MEEGTLRNELGFSQIYLQVNYILKGFCRLLLTCVDMKREHLIYSCNKAVYFCIV